MPVTIGGDSGLPLIARLVADASLRRKSGNAQRGLGCDQNQQNQECKSQRSPRPGLAVAGGKKHGTEPLDEP